MSCFYTIVSELVGEEAKLTISGISPMSVYSLFTADLRTLSHAKSTALTHPSTRISLAAVALVSGVSPSVAELTLGAFWLLQSILCKPTSG